MPATEATYALDPAISLLQAGATFSAGQMIEQPSGEAGFLNALTPLQNGTASTNFMTGAKANVAKQSGVVFLPGQEVWWDYTNRYLKLLPVATQRDYRAGLVTVQALSGAIQATLDLNKRGNYRLDALNQPALSTTVGTVAAGGFDRARRIGGCEKLLLGATTEVEKVDLLTVDGIAPGARWIFEAVIRVINGSAGTNPIFTLGVANGTSAAAPSAITELGAFQINGNSTKIYALARDTINNVAATDTTSTYTAGSAASNRVHLLIDGRALGTLNFYVNGVQVLSATTFNMSSAVGPLSILAHLYKTSAADTFEVDIDTARLWTSEQ